MTTDEAIQATFSFRKQNLPWYPRHGKRKHLAALFGSLGFREGVEIGTQRGLFAEVLCQATPELHLTCVDPWSNYSDRRRQVQRMHDEKYAIAVEKLAKYNVTIMRQLSLDAVSAFRDGSLDFAYIDGNHDFDYAMADILAWVPKVKPGGIVACHDYQCQVGNGVVLAVDAYTRAHRIDPWYVTREELATAFWVRK